MLISLKVSQYFTRPSNASKQDVYKRKGIGRLDPEIARDFSNVGPMVRASGHARDTRADHPFVGYGPVSYTHLDVYKRQAGISVKRVT